MTAVTPHRRALHKRVPSPHCLYNTVRPALRAAFVDPGSDAPGQAAWHPPPGPQHYSLKPSMLQAQQRPPAVQAQPGRTTGPSGQPAAVQPSQQGRVPAGFAANTDLLTALHQTQQSLHAARLGSQALHQAANPGQMHAWGRLNRQSAVWVPGGSSRHRMRLHSSCYVMW